MSAKNWVPHPRQEEFISLPDSIYEAMYGGAAGGGKSEVLRMLPIIRGFYKHPRFRGLYMRRTIPQLRQAIDLTREWFPSTGAVFNEDAKTWRFPSGATFQFGQAEHEKDVLKYDSNEYQYIAFDELTSFTEFQYKFLLSRIRTSADNLPLIVRSATNPGNIGHAWVRDYFVEPAPAGTLIKDKATGLLRIFIRSLVTDNHTLMQKDPGYVIRLQNLPEAERKAKLEGDWYAFSGQVFGDYREMPGIAEPDNACHVVPPFTIPDWWPRFLSVDWGTAALTCGLWGAISPQNQLFVYREYAHKGKKTIEWSQEIGELSAGEKFKDVVLCRSAFVNTGDEDMIAEKFRKHSGISARRADNNRIAGKLLLEEYLRWRPIDGKKLRPESEFSIAEAQRIQRQGTLKEYKEYLASFKQVEAVKIPKLQIFQECSQLRRAIPLCMYAKNTTDGKMAEDVAEFAGDDPYDAVRYLVCAADPFLNTVNNLATDVAEREVIRTKLAESGDQFDYYMQMQYLESKKSRGVRPIRRTGRRGGN